MISENKYDIIIVEYSEYVGKLEGFLKNYL